MPHNYIKIPQSVFPTQHDDEQVFIITRRHFVSFLTQTFILLLFAIAPFVFLALSYGNAIAILADFPIGVNDLLIILIMIYYLAIVGIGVTNFMRYYYSFLIVTNHRVYQIFQQGFFNRVLHEFFIDEIEGVTFKNRGLLGIIFNVGNIIIHFEGPQKNYEINAVPRANIISFIIDSLVRRAKPKQEGETEPELEIMGLLDGKIVRRHDPPEAIMNLSRSIHQAQKGYFKSRFKPKTLGEKFDRWWWSQLKKEHAAYLDYTPDDLTKIGEDKEGEDNRKNKS